MASPNSLQSLTYHIERAMSANSEPGQLGRGRSSLITGLHTVAAVPGLIIIVSVKQPDAGFEI